MKTLDERMDLIAQRAQIIKKTRQRRRKTAALIAAPLSLCVLLCCLWLPAVAGERTGDSAPADGANGAAGSIFSPYAQVLIQSNGNISTVTDTEFVSQLHSCISQVEQAQESKPLTIPETNYEGSASSVYICFFGADGATEQYFLSGATLTNKLTGTVNFLSTTQLMQLRTVLREVAYEK